MKQHRQTLIRKDAIYRVFSRSDQKSLTSDDDLLTGSLGGDLAF